MESLGPLGGYVVGRASWTPTLGSPFTSTMCQSSSASTVPPSSRAQKVLSAFKSAALKTTTWWLIFTVPFSPLVALLMLQGRCCYHGASNTQLPP